MKVLKDTTLRQYRYLQNHPEALKKQRQYSLAYNKTLRQLRDKYPGVFKRLLEENLKDGTLELDSNE
jgi:hypothetical protein